MNNVPRCSDFNSKCLHAVKWDSANHKLKTPLTALWSNTTVRVFR